MDISNIAESTSNGKMGSALITVILAGVLWVGKTTFEHVGQIAGLQHELEMVEQDDNALRAQYDEIVRSLNDRTRSRFTREDAEKMMTYVRALEARQHAIKESLAQDFSDLKVEIASVSARVSQPPLSIGAPDTDQNPMMAAMQIQQLEWQIASLQLDLVRLQQRVGSTDHPPMIETPPARTAQLLPSNSGR